MQPKPPPLNTFRPPLASQPSSLFWIEFLRFAVMIGVVVIHAASDVITEWGKVPDSWWWSAHVYDALVRGCVPLFIMISGALLLGKQEGFSDFFGKRFQRIAIPFIFWTAVFLVWEKLTLNPDLSLKEALVRAAGDRVRYHLWFLYIIAGLYLITPLLRILVQHARRRDLAFFLLLWFAVNSLIPAIEKSALFLFSLALRIALPIPPAQGYVGYFLLGYFLNRYASPAWLKPAAAVWALSFLVCLTGTALMTAHSGSYHNGFYSNFSPNVIAYTASFFVIIKGTGAAIEKHLAPVLRAWILSCASASFGIYLFHPLVIDVFNRGYAGFVLNGKAEHPLWMIPLTVIAVYFLSYGVVRLLLKIPFLRRTV